MVPVSGTPEFLLSDARAALRRRASEHGRPELSRAFAAWLLPETDSDFAALVGEAATREGAQQHFHTVAILGFAGYADILGSKQVDALKRGLRRQAGRRVEVDELPAAFCSDAVGVLGIVLGTKAVADAEITEHVVKWIAKFLKKSYDRERTEDWQRCLFAVADLQLGGSLRLSLPKSPATADVRTALVAKSIIGADDAAQADDDRQQTLTLAVHELADELACDRAVLRLAAVESVIHATAPTTVGKAAPQVPKGASRLSHRDSRVHDAVGAERFRTLTNAEIMTDAAIRRRLRADFQLEPGADNTKCCFDRIRTAKGYPLSRELAEKRSNSQKTTVKNGQPNPALK